MIEGVLKFVQVIGVELLEVVVLVGVVLCMFGVDMEEMEWYVFVMVVVIIKSVFFFFYFQIVMFIVGFVVKVFNFIIEDILVLLGKLVDVGFDVFMLVIVIWNILLNLVDGSGKLV